MIDQLVTKEAQRHGVYVIDKTSVTEGEFDGETKGKMSIVRNRGGTTVERWEMAGLLDKRQMGAIDLYRWAWRLKFGSQNVGMNWSLTASIRGLRLTDFVANAAEADGTLAEFDAHVFRWLPTHCADVWKNVVVFDEPAGVAGGRLGYSPGRGAQVAAQTIVRLVCDMAVMRWRL